MKEKIPSNIIIKTAYANTQNLLKARYFGSIIDQIMIYIKEHPNNYEYLEIEAKLGKFEFKGDSIKVLDKIYETFIIPDTIPNNQNNRFIFHAGVLQKDFFLIWSALDKESKLIGANIDVIKPLTYIDTIYKTNKRLSVIYQDGHAIKEEVIRKENKKNINVRNYGHDFRITCSEEMPTEIDEKMDIKENVREKFRISYQLSYYRVDLTISKDSNSNEYAYEIELELNKLKTELVGNKKFDENKIRTILDRFLQNIMNLYSVLSPDVIINNTIHEEELNYDLGYNNHLSPKEIQSKYGNYFKNNLLKK